MKKNVVHDLIVVFWRFLICSMCFYLTNIVFLGLLFTVHLTIVTAPLYLVALIIAYPSIGALGDLLRNRQWTTEVVEGAKLYWHYYWVNKWKYTKIGLLFTAIFLFLAADLYGANAIMKNGLFMPLVLVLTMIALVLLAWVIGIQSYFQIDVKNSLKMAYYAASHYALNSVCLIALLFALYMAFSFIPQFVIFIAAPLFVQGTMLITQRPLHEMRHQIKITELAHG